MRALAWASAIALPFWLARSSMVLRLSIARAIITSSTITEIVAIKAKPRRQQCLPDINIRGGCKKECSLLLETCFLGGAL